MPSIVEEVATCTTNTSQVDAVPIIKSDSYRCKVIKESKNLLWEIEGFEEIMSEGIQKSVSLDFEMGKEGEEGQVSKWRIQLETVDEEPALIVYLLTPFVPSSSTRSTPNKVIYYKFSAQVVKQSDKDGPNIISFPTEDYYYECTDNVETAKKFTLNRQLNFGCSFSSWMSQCLTSGGSIQIKILFQIAQTLQCKSSNK